MLAATAGYCLPVCTHCPMRTRSGADYRNWSGAGLLMTSPQPHMTDKSSRLTATAVRTVYVVLVLYVRTNAVDLRVPQLYLYSCTGTRTVYGCTYRYHGTSSLVPAVDVRLEGSTAELQRTCTCTY
jgi:hypothetical protein